MSAPGKEGSIPVINISQVDTQTGNEMVAAAARWGFVFVKGKELGFTPEVIDAIFELVRSKLPPLQKYRDHGSIPNAFRSHATSSDLL